MGRRRRIIRKVYAKPLRAVVVCRGNLLVCFGGGEETERDEKKEEKANLRLYSHSYVYIILFLFLIFKYKCSFENGKKIFRIKKKNLTNIVNIARVNEKKDDNVRPEKEKKNNVFRKVYNIYSFTLTVHGARVHA